MAAYYSVGLLLHPAVVKVAFLLWLIQRSIVTDLRELQLDIVGSVHEGERTKIHGKTGRIELQGKWERIVRITDNVCVGDVQDNAIPRITVEQ